MTDIKKQDAIKQFIGVTKKITADNVTRENIEQVLEGLKELAVHPDWWSDELYPAPTRDELQARHLIHEESDSTYALYLNVMKPGKKIVPHNHTTWACIAAVEGAETNYIYERLDDQSQAGYAVLKEVGIKQIKPGDGIALLADDIHAVHIDDGVIRHLHMYGLALEKLDRRLAFDLQTNTYTVMPIGVKTRR